MTILLSIFIIVHGLIHFIGFAKAFNLFTVKQLTGHISKLNGVLWLLAGVLFILAAIMFFMQKEWWWMLAVPAIGFSQYLIVLSWRDAMYGTVANVIILAACIGGFGVWFFKKKTVHKHDISFNQITKQAISINHEYRPENYHSNPPAV
ncbi:hypothetical protein BH09BAC6_BH09BAC6_15020 [soil metagenome]|jgi:predicted transporter